MYIVIELQTNTDGTVGVLTTQHEDLLAAESQYHQVLFYAAVSALPKHTAMIITEDGALLRSESYTHAPVEPEPIEPVEPESEEEE